MPVAALPRTCQTEAPSGRDTNCTDCSGTPTPAAETVAVSVVGAPRVAVAGADIVTCRASADVEAAPRSADAAGAPTTSGGGGAGGGARSGRGGPRGLWRGG